MFDRFTAGAIGGIVAAIPVGIIAIDSGIFIRGVV